MKKDPVVEDPVNLYMHRPLAYAFVKSIFHTSMTPNQVTVLAIIVGVSAGMCWLYGSSVAMVLGGVLLWASAILDGADGILARAKKLDSPFGRALDGAADGIVAIFTVLPGFAHIYIQDHSKWWMLVLAVPAILSALMHLYTYDFYKESFLFFTRPGNNKDGQNLPDVEKRVEKIEEEGGPILTRWAMRYALLGMMQSQHRIIELFNPAAIREGKAFERTESTAARYREINALPMRLWTVVSLAPHSYIMAICGMFDRLDIYLWIRLVFMNMVYAIAAVVQRRATLKTLQD
ncbi:MAG: CDP-alcohol phosphatidyltransferase family protein [Myxococcales bacterium]|nr:MAG: CDP-alcohol phosphatidyltransferase family protein [Myxococcales bacterium]